MAESAPRDPHPPEGTVDRHGPGFIIGHSIDGGETPRTVRPLAANARAYLEAAGLQATNPGRAHAFILNKIRRGAKDPARVPLLPTNMVTQKLQDEVIPADRAAEGDEVRWQNRMAERTNYIRSAVLHYPLPEVWHTMDLQIELRSLRRDKEADSLSALLEAYGRVISTLQPSATVLVWARGRRDERAQKRGL